MNPKLKKAAFLSLAASAAILVLSSEAWASLSFRTEKLSLALPSQKSILAELRLPKGIADTRVPAVLIFGGFESAGAVLDLVHTDEPVVLASFDYPYDAPREFRFPGSFAEAPRIKSMIRETDEGIVALVQALQARPEVDPTRIFIVGASFGSPFALRAAAEIPAIRGIAIVHGFGQVSRTAEQVMLRSWEPRFGIWARASAWVLSRVGWAYLAQAEPESYARVLRSGQEVLMVTAKEDSFVPRSASDSLRDALQNSSARFRRIDMEGEHLLPGSDAKIAQILGLIRVWIREMGK